MAHIMIDRLIKVEIVKPESTNAFFKKTNLQLQELLDGRERAHRTWQDYGGYNSEIRRIRQIIREKIKSTTEHRYGKGMVLKVSIPGTAIYGHSIQSELTGKDGVIAQIKREYRKRCGKREYTWGYAYKTRSYHFRVSDDSDSGFIHLTEGNFLKMFKSTQLKKFVDMLARNHAPTNMTAHIGIELEFVSKFDQASLREMLAESLMENSKYVTLKCDASISAPDGFNGHEVTICSPRPILATLLRQVCRALKIGKTNRSCGLHVHLDMRNKPTDDIRKVYQNLIVTHKSLFNLMLPKSRLNNQYARINPSYDMNDQGGRYYQVNGHSLSKFNTLEIRSHSSTLSAAKIWNWIRLLECSMQVGTTFQRVRSNREKFMQELKLTRALKYYVNTRIKKFSGDTFAEEISRNRDHSRDSADMLRDDESTDQRTITNPTIDINSRGRMEIRRTEVEARRRIEASIEADHAEMPF